jgi:hypothetical protein
MKGREIVDTVNKRRSNDHRFVKWWRKESDFLDYDLVDHFVDSVGGADEIGGVDLLTMDDMWQEVRRVSGTRVTLLHGSDGDKVRWVHEGKSGVSTNVCRYTPETLMEIFDVETKGNPVDS